jgi:hypothetical protein
LLTTPDAQNRQGGPLRGMNIRPSGIGVKATDSADSVDNSPTDSRNWSQFRNPAILQSCID